MRSALLLAVAQQELEDRLAGLSGEPLLQMGLGSVRTCRISSSLTESRL